MLTEDITLPTDGSWTLISYTTTQSICFNGSGTDLMYRFGAGSTSNGMRLEAGQILLASENVYFKPSPTHIGTSKVIKITVTR